MSKSLDDFTAESLLLRLPNSTKLSRLPLGLFLTQFSRVTASAATDKRLSCYSARARLLILSSRSGEQNNLRKLSAVLLYASLAAQLQNDY